MGSPYADSSGYLGLSSIDRTREGAPRILYATPSPGRPCGITNSSVASSPPSPTTSSSSLSSSLALGDTTLDSLRSLGSSVFAQDECLRCHAITDHQMRCVNRDISCHGLPPCAGIWCPGCYQAEDWIFHTIHDDGRALAMRPIDTRKPGWRCHLCELSCMLGRGLAPDDQDWEVCQLAIQYKIDSAHHIAASTANGYQNAWNLLQQDVAYWHGRPLDYPEAAPNLPPLFPARQHGLEVGMSIVKATSALNTTGRGEDGQCTFNTARARRSAFAHIMGRHPGICSAVQDNLEFRAFVLGCPRRVGTMSTPSMALHIETLFVLLGLAATAVRQALHEQDFSLALREMAYRLVLIYSFFLITRGNEPFRLRQHHWREGIWLGTRARSQGMPEHLRFSFQFPTKTLQTSFKEGVLAPVTASGVRIGALTEQYAAALTAHGHTLGGEWAHPEGRLFPSPRGAQWRCGLYLREYLRPRPRVLQDLGHPPLLGVNIADQFDMWSVRRGATTWAAVDSAAIPRVAEEDKEEHVGWTDPARKATRTSRGYSQKPIEERVKVTSLGM